MVVVLVVVSMPFFPPLQDGPLPVLNTLHSFKLACNSTYRVQQDPPVTPLLPASQVPTQVASGRVSVGHQKTARRSEVQGYLAIAPWDVCFFCWGVDFF